MSKGQESIESQYGWVIVFGSLAIHTVGLGAPIALWVALKPIAAEFDWPRSIPSLAYSLMMIGAGAGGILMGWWMDKRGVLQPVLFGATMIATGALVAAMSEGRWSLYVANGLLLGFLGKSAMLTPLIANVTHWFDQRRGLAVAIIASGQGLAGAIWPPLFRLLNDNYGWRETYLVYGVISFVVMVPLSLTILRHSPPISPGIERSLDGEMSNGRVLNLPENFVQALLCIATIGCCTAMAVPIVHLVSHGTDLGYPRARAAELLTVLFTAAFFSRILYGILADKIGPIKTLMIGSASQAVMLLAFSSVTTLPALYVSAFLFGIGFAGIMPCYPLIIRLLFAANQAGWRIAIFYMFAALGMALGGWMGGYVYDLTGEYTQAFRVAFVFTLLNFCTVSFIYLRQKN